MSDEGRMRIVEAVERIAMCALEILKCIGMSNGPPSDSLSTTVPTYPIMPGNTCKTPGAENITLTAVASAK